MKRSVLCLSLLAAAAVLCLPAVASAQVKRSDWTKDGGEHVFLDDDLLGAVGSPYGSWLKHRRPAARTLLIRPRSTFVPEMYKSVEDI
jgi:hypothetical protein